MKRVLKKVLIGIAMGLIWTAISLAIDFLKLPDFLREFGFFTLGFFYCAYIIDKS